MSKDEYGNDDNRRYTQHEAYEEIHKLLKRMLAMELAVAKIKPRVGTIEDALTELNNLNLDANDVCEDLFPDFEDEGSAEAFNDFDRFDRVAKGPEVKEKSTVEMAAEAFGEAQAFGAEVANHPEFKKMFNELPDFDSLLSANNPDEFDYTVRYLKTKGMMEDGEKLFNIVVELVEELERVKRGD